MPKRRCSDSVEPSISQSDRPRRSKWVRCKMLLNPFARTDCCRWALLAGAAPRSIRFAKQTMLGKEQSAKRCKRFRIESPSICFRRASSKSTWPILQSKRDRPLSKLKSARVRTKNLKWSLQRRSLPSRPVGQARSLTWQKHRHQSDQKCFELRLAMDYFDGQTKCKSGRNQLHTQNSMPNEGQMQPQHPIPSSMRSAKQWT